MRQLAARGYVSLFCSVITPQIQMAGYIKPASQNGAAGRVLSTTVSSTVDSSIQPAFFLALGTRHRTACSTYRTVLTKTYLTSFTNQHASNLHEPKPTDRAARCPRKKNADGQIVPNLVFLKKTNKTSQ
jgi:hypothetical protein